MDKAEGVRAVGQAAAMGEARLQGKRLVACSLHWDTTFKRDRKEVERERCYKSIQNCLYRRGIILHRLHSVDRNPDSRITEPGQRPHKVVDMVRVRLVRLVQRQPHHARQTGNSTVRAGLISACAKFGPRQLRDPGQLC